MRHGRSLVPLIIAILPAITAFPQQPKQSVKSNPAGCGPLTGQVLKCSRFGFTYTVPFGWVDRTNEMQDEASGQQSGESNSAGNQEPRNKPETLLAVFERPPGAPGQTINSAVVIAAEPLSDYRGVKTAADYFVPVTELAEQRGFKVVNEPYEFRAGAAHAVRSDFSKERGKLTMWQSTVAMIEKGYIVSFTFVGGDEDEEEELISKLSFTARGQARK